MNETIWSLNKVLYNSKTFRTQEKFLPIWAASTMQCGRMIHITWYDCDQPSMNKTQHDWTRLHKVVKSSVLFLRSRFLIYIYIYISVSYLSKPTVHCHNNSPLQGGISVLNTIALCDTGKIHNKQNMLFLFLLMKWIIFLQKNIISPDLK